MVPQVVTGNSLFHSHSGSCLLPLSMLGMGFGMGNGGGIRAGGLEVLLGADFYPWGWGQGAAGTGVSCEALGWLMDPLLLGLDCGWMHPCCHRELGTGALGT